ncbi:MAG: hypothetical protein QUV05_20440 [Phycisphaerae bacterium]|nr:hypothetical protein [Phycisphaerae bacterium]
MLTSSLIQPHKPSPFDEAQGKSFDEAQGKPVAVAKPLLAETVDLVKSIAIRALKRMYLPSQRLFVFRIRRTPGGDLAEGLSRRYTAIVLIGLRQVPAEAVREVLHSDTCEQVCQRLLADLDRMDDLGEVALTAWAARAMDHPGAATAVERLRAMQPADRPWPTVETAWALAALTSSGGSAGQEDLAARLADRLVAACHPDSGLFAHRPNGLPRARLRSHIGCFADQVYPIQALSYYYQWTGDPRAIAAASRCARQLCELQGAAGQWWWHYDIRTGRVVEGYPVYAVHQDAMGPMALFALRDAVGQDHQKAVTRSMDWLVTPPELERSLIDAEACLIWRKVARREVGKIVRRTQALVSRLHPCLRAPAVDRLFPACCVDWESRPYHMGWLLHAWKRDGVRRVDASPR